MKGFCVGIVFVCQLLASHGHGVGSAENIDRLLHLIALLVPEDAQVAGVPVTPGQGLAVGHLHDPETLLGAPVVWPG